MLLVSACSAGYRETDLFSGLDLSVDSRESAVIIGPSGCGKSTLLKVIAGLHAPRAGMVSFDGEPVVSGDHRVGLVLQGYGLFPWMTVRENVSVGLRIRGLASEATSERCAELLLRMGLDSFEGSYPAELSGGQQQRVALARTLAVNPRLLLLDEPFSAVDALTREYLQDLLVGILDASEMVAVMVTHDISEAAYLGDSVYSMSMPPDCRLSRFEGSPRPPTHPAGYRSSWEYARRCREVRVFLEERRGG